MKNKKLDIISQLDPLIQPLVLAAFLSRLFEQKNVLLTVVGGAAVQYYTQGEYNTGDLDAILHGDSKEIIEEVMNGLGFNRTSMFRHFEHPLFPDFVVEFPPAPVEIGGRHIEKLSRIETSEGVVRIVRIEDLIIDRLLAGVFWKDQASLDQARLLWIKNKDQIDVDYLKTFAKEEKVTDALKKVIK